MVRARVQSLRSVMAISGALTALAILTTSASAHAWGKRGHSIVCQTAAYLAAQSPKGEFLKSHSFDLGYYCNVPDLVWKKPNTYKVEWTNHFMDMEIFDRGLKNSKVEKPFELERGKFNSEFPEIKDEAGRAYWRIRELGKRLDEATAKLNRTDLSKDDRHKAQADWLVTSGAIGHYVGDLAQPLHVTENYDGQMSEQKGIHSFYEEALVDELFFQRGLNLEDRVQRLAESYWPAYKKKVEKMSDQQLLEMLAKESNAALADVLKTDKKVGRKDIKKAAKAHQASITRRLVAGSLAEAELLRRRLGWDYNGDRFFTFVSEPDFIAPPVSEAPSKNASPTPAPEAH